MTLGSEGYSSSTGREISFSPGLAAIPERLLLAHAQGKVLFIAGAGVSQPAGHPNFRTLVLKVYEELDASVYNILKTIPESACNRWVSGNSSLTYEQAAEVQRFINRDYDVVLGMLERRMDSKPGANSRVRKVVTKILRDTSIKPSALHKTLMNLSDRGGSVTTITTNFDLLLEKASRGFKPTVKTYSLGSIPRAGKSNDFSGVLHIHGALETDEARPSDLIISDQDFGEFYLRRRVVPDFIYDAARLFHLVLVGYSANDPPMRYLLNAVAADGSRFDDLKERFAFIGTSGADPIQVEDWKGRGITPIPYDSGTDHSVLHKTLARWAALSSNHKPSKIVNNELKRIVRKKRSNTSEADRDLVDYFMRRSNPIEREQLSKFLSENKADVDWLDAILHIAQEKIGSGV